MYEVELKFRAEHEALRDRLAELDATDVGTVVQKDTYFDAPDRDFASTDEALRIRHETGEGRGETVFLTYKGPLVDEQSKTRTEAETAVDDESAMRSILTGLGYDAAATVSKERDQYVIDECLVTLDAVKGLGEFVEIERHQEADIDSEADIDAAREAILEVVEALGFDPAEQVRTSYLGLLLQADEDTSTIVD
jgi:adenylate cyclase class 2